MAKRLCSADDIMIGRYGPPIFQILQGIEGAYNVALMKAIPKKGNKDFIRSWLKQDCLLKYLEALSGRTAGQDGIQMDKLKAYPFPYPPIELQDQWVKIDKQIDKSKFILQKMIEKLELLKKSRFVEMFGTPVTNNKNWETVPLKQACSLITDGSHFSPEAEENGEYPMLSVKDMGENNFNYDECKYIGKETFNNLVSNGCCPQKNDVLVAKDGSYWKKAFVVNEDKKQVLLSSIAILRPDNQKISSRFLRDYVLSKEITSLVDRQFVTGTALKRVILKGIREIPIYLPPIELQKKYEKQINQLDKSKFILQKMIEKLEFLKKSRFVEMFGNIKETIPLENCCSLISDFVASGSFASLRDNVKYYDKENYAVLVRTIDFANNFSKDLVYTDKHGYDFLSKTNLYGGEILLSNIGASIGKVFRVPYLNKPMTLAPNSIVIKPNDNYTNEFLEYFFSIGRGQDELHVMTTATATPKFNKTQKRQVPVPKVTKQNQKDISCFVKQLDKSKLYPGP